MSSGSRSLTRATSHAHSALLHTNTRAGLLYDAVAKVQCMQSEVERWIKAVACLEQEKSGELNAVHGSSECIDMMAASRSAGDGQDTSASPTQVHPQLGKDDDSRGWQPWAMDGRWLIKRKEMGQQLPGQEAGGCRDSKQGHHAGAGLRCARSYLLRLP